MGFENDVQEMAYKKVKNYLTELFDEQVHDEDDGHIYVRYGSTVLEVAVEPYGPEEAAVVVMAFVAQGVTLDEELLAGLLELNHQVPFGAFSLVEQDIFYSYSLFGRSLDRRGLLGALAAVATISDDYDDKIVAKFGGETAQAKINE